MPMWKFNHNKMVDLMQEKRWCAADIAELTGISHRTVRKYMRGDCEEITVIKAGLIANALGVNIEKLLMRCSN